MVLMATTVLIVDDHTAFRSRARRMLEADGFEVVGEAADGASGVDAARRLEPDVVRWTCSCPTRPALRSPRRSAATPPSSSPRRVTAPTSTRSHAAAAPSAS